MECKQKKHSVKVRILPTGRFCKIKFTGLSEEIFHYSCCRMNTEPIILAICTFHSKTSVIYIYVVKDPSKRPPNPLVKTACCSNASSFSANNHIALRF